MIDFKGLERQSGVSKMKNEIISYLQFWMMYDSWVHDNTYEKKKKELYNHHPKSLVDYCEGILPKCKELSTLFKDRGVPKYLVR